MKQSGHRYPVMWQNASGTWVELEGKSYLQRVMEILMELDVSRCDLGEKSAGICWFTQATDMKDG